MTMQAMYDQLVKAGFTVDKRYDTLSKGYQFTISKDDRYTSALFEYPADTSKAYCDQKQREFIDFIINKWHDDHACTQTAPKLGKKLIFVGMKNREIAEGFMSTCINVLLAERVPIDDIDYAHLTFETPHTEVRYICFDRCTDDLDGHYADAIFGREPFITVLRLYLKPDVEEPGEKRIGLVDYICRIEHMYGASQKVTAALMKGENNMPTKKEEFVSYCRRDVASYAAMREVQDRNDRRKLPGIKTAHFSGPVTAVIWEDGTKTLVRCKEGEVPDYEKGFAMAIAKKALGTNKSGSNYYDIFKKYLPKPEVEEEAIEEPVEEVPEEVIEVVDMREEADAVLDYMKEHPIVLAEPVEEVPEEVDATCQQ